MILRRAPSKSSSDPAEPTAAAEAGAQNGAIDPVDPAVVELAAPAAAREPGAEPEPYMRVCRRCSTSLAPDQEWCLECGTTTTHIRRPPDWRIPVAVVVAVIAIAVAGFIVAIVRLSGSTGNGSGSPMPPAASAGGLITVAEWPPHVTGWTVVLARSRSEAVAYAKASELVNQGTTAGVLHSSDHPGWVRGFWVVFSGRYGSQGEAKAAAVALASKGHRRAHARLVEQPRS